MKIYLPYFSFFYKANYILLKPALNGIIMASNPLVRGEHFFFMLNSTTVFRCCPKGFSFEQVGVGVMPPI
jgi:hypothetical protein